MVVRKSTEKRALLIMLKKRGLTDRAVAAEVGGITYPTVNRIYRDYLNGKDVFLPRHSNGRPRKLTESEVHWATLLLERGLARTAAELQREYFPDVDVSTVQRGLRSENYRAYKRRKAPFLSSKKRSGRLTWGRAHYTWTWEDWRKAAFSDESKFLVFGYNGPDIYWKEVGGPVKPSHVKQVVKFGGGSVMVWGYIIWEGVGELHLIEGTLDSQKYTQILSEAFLGTISRFRRRSSNVIFQHDNDPKHTSRMTQKWLLDKKISVLPWPSNSPDMNPIEQVWAYLDKEVRLRPVLPTNRHDLWKALPEEWYKIPPRYIQGLFKLMPRRIAALIKAKGGHTKY